MRPIKITDRKFYKATILNYRVIQTAFQLFLIATLVLSAGWLSAIGFIFIHWFGTQDILYYIIGNFDFPKYWTWLNWTPLGIVWKRDVDKKKRISNKYILIQALVGVILTTVLYLISNWVIV
jgi:hypothetical protein